MCQVSRSCNTCSANHINPRLKDCPKKIQLKVPRNWKFNTKTKSKKNWNQYKLGGIWESLKKLMLLGNKILFNRRILLSNFQYLWTISNMFSLFFSFSSYWKFNRYKVNSQVALKSASKCTFILLLYFYFYSYKSYAYWAILEK